MLHAGKAAFQTPHESALPALLACVPFQTKDYLKIVHGPSLLDKAFEELGYGSAADAVEWLNHGGGIREVNAAWLSQILVEPMPRVMTCSHSALKLWGETASSEASDLQEFLRRAHQDDVHSVPHYSSLSVQT